MEAAASLSRAMILSLRIRCSRSFGILRQWKDVLVSIIYGGALIMAAPCDGQCRRWPQLSGVVRCTTRYAAGRQHKETPRGPLTGFCLPSPSSPRGVALREPEMAKWCWRKKTAPKKGIARYCMAILRIPVYCTGPESVGGVSHREVTLPLGCPW